VGVGDVGLGAVARVEHGGDAALGPGAGAVFQAALGDEGDFELVGEAQGERLACKTTAQDQYIESGHFGNSAGRYGGTDYSMGAVSCRNRQNPSG
jgi:hypothetical protein